MIKGGSNRYVEKLVAGHRDCIRLNTPVRSIKRRFNQVEIASGKGETEVFDYVFMACHADQALRLLADPSLTEEQVLSAFRYQANEAVLHFDETLMPKRKRAWAAWNYHIPAEPKERVALTYNMNILQSIQARQQFCVSLNHSEAIREDRIIQRFEYDHPIFTAQSIEAQKQHAEINGRYRTYYCGAYWRNGFHEDGVVSALNALQHFKDHLENEKRDFRRAG